MTVLDDDMSKKLEAAEIAEKIRTFYEDLLVYSRDKVKLVSSSNSDVSKQLYCLSEALSMVLSATLGPLPTDLRAFILERMKNALETNDKMYQVLRMMPEDSLESLAELIDAKFDATLNNQKTTN